MKIVEDSLKSDASKKAIIKSQYQLEYNKKSIELAAEQEAASKIEAEGDEYAKMQATLEANRDAILSLEDDETNSNKIEKENEASKTPEQIATGRHRTES